MKLKRAIDLVGEDTPVTAWDEDDVVYREGVVTSVDTADLAVEVEDHQGLKHWFPLQSVHEGDIDEIDVDSDLFDLADLADYDPEDEDVLSALVNGFAEEEEEE